jgi:hypothetical protein
MFENGNRATGALGVLGIILWVIAFALGNGSPDTTDSNAKIIAWYASSSNQNEQIVTFLLVILGAMCILVFLSGLRGHLARAEGGGAGLASLAYGAGVAALVLLVTAVALFTAPAFLISDGGMSVFVPSSFRSFNDAGFEFWVAASAIAALTVWATSLLALRTGALPRWFGWLGVVAGILQLLAIFFIPALAYWLWLLIASILLLRAPAGPVVKSEVRAHG